MTDAPATSDAAAPPQTENRVDPRTAGEISSLAQYRARQQASSPAQPATAEVGGVSPEPDAVSRPDNREQAIPRERFDQVNQQKNEAVQRAEMLQAQLQAFQLQQQAQAQFQSPTGMANQPQPVRPQAPITQSGMQGAAPAMPDFSNPTVKKQWRDKITNDPIDGLREFVSVLIQGEGAPLLQQFQQEVLGQVTSQLTPLQRGFAEQQVGQYETSRSNADASFAQVAPAFRELVNTAVSQGYSLTPQNLAAIEGIARAQAGLPFGAPTPPAPTFSERPGSAGNFGQAPTPVLTAQQRNVARMAGMTDQQYIEWYAKNGVEL